MSTLPSSYISERQQVARRLLKTAETFHAIALRVVLRNAAGLKEGFHTPEPVHCQTLDSHRLAESTNLLPEIAQM